MRGAKKFLFLLAASAACVPGLAWAADDPIVIVRNVTNGLINFFMIVAPSLGTAAIMALGTMYIVTNDSGKKGDYKKNMKEILFIVALVLSAGAIMKWFIGLLG
ncbi:hypothetical protein [Ectobacillus ponti]|uniref:Conjugal transfer protein n=1 Tax=Ectobacillus ponti TaxID=2961894 RepID=A0AA41X599_9BACI|nr:hypothetical protein [Ectobacillus ponti]MCP8968947.1 hypothetical protein [Ectobacillus ponti]